MFSLWLTSTEQILQTRIEGSDVLSQDVKDELLRFSSELGLHNYSTGRRVKLLQYCPMLAGDAEKYDPDELPEPELVDILGDSGRWVSKSNPESPLTVFDR